MKDFLRLVVLGIVLSVGMPAARAEQAAEVVSEEEAIRANAKAYESAYARGDVGALAAFFTEDAEYTDETGRTHSGREAIAARIESGLRANPGGKLEIAVDSVRQLGPGILSRKGPRPLSGVPGSAPVRSTRRSIRNATPTGGLPGSSTPPPRTLLRVNISPSWPGGLGTGRRRTKPPV